MAEITQYGRCAECVYFSVLEHDFVIGDGYKQDTCCVMFPLTERKGYVVQVEENDMCEEFQRRKNNG